MTTDIYGACLTLLTSEEQPEAGSEDQEQWRDQISSVLQAIKAEQLRRTEEQAISRMSKDTNFSLLDLQDMMNKNAADNTFPPPIINTNSTTSELPTTDSVDFGTAQKFNSVAIIKLRKRHETDEARSAITYRYRHSRCSDSLPTSTSTNTEAPKPTEAGAAKLKGRILNEIISTISSSLMAKDNTRELAGSARLARWRAQGVYPESASERDPAAVSFDTHGDSSCILPQDLLGVSGHFPSSRKPYQKFESKDKPELRFTTANISETHPLRSGSFIVFVYCGKMYLGRGEFELILVPA